MTTSEQKIIQFNVTGNGEYECRLWVLTAEGKLFARQLGPHTRWKEISGPYDPPEHPQFATRFKSNESQHNATSDNIPRS